MSGEKVLVVGSSLKKLKTLAEDILLPNGFEPFLAEGQEEGLKIAQTNPPQLLMLYLSLDSSLNFLHDVSKVGLTIPVILIVEQGTGQVTLEFFRLGVKDYIVSPFVSEDVLQIVQRVLEQVHPSTNQPVLTPKQEKANRELERRQKEFDILLKIGRSISSLLDLDAVLGRITEAAVFITGAEEGYLLLLDDESGELRLRAAKNLGEKTAQGFSVRVSDSIAGKVVRLGKPVLLTGEGEQKIKVKTGHLVKSLLNVPLKVNDQVIGVLGVTNQISSSPFTSAHLNRLLLLADMAAIALENAREHTEMRQRFAFRIKEFATLRGVIDQLSRITDFDVGARLALSMLLKATKADVGVLAWTADRHKHPVRYISLGNLGELTFNHHGRTPAHPWWDSQAWDSQALQEVIDTGQPILDQNLGENGRSGEADYALSRLIVPMHRGEQIVGAIDLESCSAHTFSQEDLQFVSSIADQIAMALDGAILQKKAKLNRERCMLLMEAVDNAVWLLDANLKLVSQNEASKKLMDWSSSEVVGQSIFELIPTQNHKPHPLGSLLKQVINEQKPISFTQGILVAKNQFIVVNGRAVPIVQEGRAAGVVCAFWKATAEKSAKQLELEFVNMASHLLRNPLNFIQTSIDLLIDSDLDIGEKQTILDGMREQSHRLSEATNELLKMLLLDVEEVRVNAKPTSILTLIERVLDLIQNDDPRYTFDLTAPDELPTVVADPTKTELVLLNLLTSAVKRCQNRGYISIELEVRPSEVIISVVDDGEAISARPLDRIFGQFYSVDDEGGKMPATYQLGLYATKRLVELQNGCIWVESEPGQGSRFSFSLPVWEENQ